MKLSLISLIGFATFCVCTASSEHREKRQIGDYSFPGPRARADDYSSETPTERREESDRRYEDAINQHQPVSTAVRTQPQHTAAAQTYRPQVADVYPSSYGRGNQQAGYASAGYRGNARSSGGYSPAPKAYTKPEVQNFGGSFSPGGQNLKKTPEEEEEEQQKPSKLELLLQTSKFGCSGKKDGYYADSSVNCEVFHYCVSGAKHSWMCPEGTVFHQVHLNCVPASQDICSDSDKYSAQVNDFLYKPLDQRGPNNTVRYHQRFYPEEFLGDPLLTAFPQTQSFGYNNQEQPPQKPASQPRPYSDYDSYNSNEDDYRPQPAPVRPQPRLQAPVRPQPQPQPQPKPQSSYNPAYSQYQPKPTPVQIPASVYKPVPKPAPAPLAYTPPSYRPPEQRRPPASSYPESYNNYAASYTPTASKPAQPYNTYNNYGSSAVAKPAPTSGYSNYKPTSGYSSQSSYQQPAPYKPVSNVPKATAGGSYSPSYPTYPPYSSSNYDSSESSSSPRYGNNQRPTVRTPNEYTGVAYEEDY